MQVGQVGQAGVAVEPASWLWSAVAAVRLAWRLSAGLLWVACRLADEVRL